MPDQAQEYAQQVMNAFNELIGKSLVTFEAGWEQTTAAAKLFAAAAETEQEEARKAWQRVADYTQARDETLTEALKDLTGTNPSPQAKERLDQLFDQDRSFFKAWSDDMLGFQQRQASLSKDLIESNAKIVELSQNITQSAAQYGEAVQAWATKTVEESSAKTTTG